jgi:RNA polymerase sigma-70 factor (ECF subfamily)
MTSSAVVATNHALALAEINAAEAGLAVLAMLCRNPEFLNFHPFHAARAELLWGAGRFEEAKQAYQIAIGLATNPTIRRFLQTRANSGMQ